MKDKHGYDYDKAEDAVSYNDVSPECDYADHLIDMEQDRKYDEESTSDRGKVK